MARKKDPRGGPGRGQGRKPLPPGKAGVQISIRIKPETLQKIDACAEKNQMSRGVVIDMLLHLATKNDPSRAKRQPDRTQEHLPFAPPSAK